MTVASKEFLEVMINKGLLVIIQESFTKPSQPIFEHVLWSLCNIISETPEYKVKLYEMNLYNLVINTFNTYKKSETVRKTFAWFVSNSLRCKPYLHVDMVG